MSSTRLDLSTFAQLLADYYQTRGGQLPQLELSQDTTLGYAVDQLRNQQLINEEDGAEAIRNVVADFERAVGDEFMNSQGLDKLDQLSDLFEERIRTSFEDLKTVRNWVDELTQKIEDQKDQRISEDPFLSQYYGQAHDVEPTFPEISWQPIQAVGYEREIVMNVNSRMPGMDGRDATEPSVMSRLSRQLKDRLNKEYQDVEVTEDTENRIVDQLTEVTGHPSDVVRPYVKQLLNYRNGTRRLATLINGAGTVRGSTDTCTTFLSDIDKYTMLQRIPELIDLSESTSTAMQTNLDLIKQLTELMAYYIIHCRRSVYENSIVLPNGQLNPDLKQDYLESGGTLLKLKQYINVFYPGDKLRESKHGVTLDSAKHSEELVEQKLSKQEIEKATRAKSEYRKIMKDVFTTTVDKWIQQGRSPEVPRTLQTPEDRAREMVQYTADSVINTTPVEDALYNLILRLYYKNEFVKTLYDRLGQESIKMLTSRENIDESKIRLIETRVVTSMVSDFVINSGLAKLTGV